MKLVEIKDWLGEKTWRIRHLWSHGHWAWQLDFRYSGHKCIRCYRYQQRHDKGEVV